MNLLTWEECAALLRREPNLAARQLLYQLAKEGLPFVQVGRQRLYDRGLVETWLRERAEHQAEGRAAPAPASRPSPRARRRPAAGGAPRTIADLAARRQR